MTSAVDDRVSYLEKNDITRKQQDRAEAPQEPIQNVQGQGSEVEQIGASPTIVEADKNDASEAQNKQNIAPIVPASQPVEEEAEKILINSSKQNAQPDEIKVEKNMA